MWRVSRTVVVLAQYGFPLRMEDVGPFLMLCLVLRFLFIRLAVPAWLGCATLHVVYMLYVVIVTYFVGALIVT